jgi:hypothetical protein
MNQVPDGHASDRAALSAATFSLSSAARGNKGFEMTVRALNDGQAH